MSTKADDTHLQRPHPPDPHLQFALNTVDVVQLDALPPASTCWLPPKEEQLLRHAHRVVAHLVTPNIGAQPRQGQAADNGLVRLPCPVAPQVVMVESAVGRSKVTLATEKETYRTRKSTSWRARMSTYPAVSISIRCASVVPGSSLLLRPEKIPFWRSSALAAARLTAIISGWSILALGGRA